MPYQYVHKNCGGQISVWRMRCTRCRKQWNPISILFTNGIRPVYVESKRKPTKGAKWGNKVPVANTLVGFLPNWPRWARVLTVIILVGIIFVVIWAVWG